MPKQVMTVRGPIAPEELGFTQTHEHLFVDLSWVKYRWQEMPITDEAQMIQEVQFYKEAGGDSLVEVTLEHIGRDPAKIRRVSEATDVHIVMGTGFYREPYYPEFVNKTSTNELAKYILNEIKHGVGDTGIKPGIIGEIGIDKGWIQGVEERVIRAAARAYQESGLTVTTHTPPHMSLAFFEILDEEGVPPDRIIFGHLDNTLEMDELERVLATGAYVQFDLIGIQWINTDARRAKVLAELIGKGYTDQLLLSLDLATRARLITNGGTGFPHLIKNFLPLLRQEGISDETIHQLMHVNPARALAV